MDRKGNDADGDVEQASHHSLSFPLWTWTTFLLKVTTHYSWSNAPPSVQYCDGDEMFPRVGPNHLSEPPQVAMVIIFAVLCEM